MGRDVLLEVADTGPGLSSGHLERVFERFFRADPSRARKSLGWQPKVEFKELVRIMVDADLELSGQSCPGEGRKILKERFSGWHRWEHQVISMEK